MTTTIDEQFLMSLVSGLFVGGAAGYLGSLMVLKRMALVGDALSHVALPGIGLAILYNLNPFFGGFVFLIVGILLIAGIERATRLPTEALVGVLFTASLAIGFLIIPEPEVLEALFGDITQVDMFDTALSVVLSALVIVAAYVVYNRVVLSTISEDLARSQGIQVGVLNLFYLLLVAAVVALGIKAVGALLMGALVIVPAAAAKNFTSNLRGYSSLAALIGVVSSVGGIVLFGITGLHAGPLVILVAVAIFAVSVLAKR